VWCHPTVAAGAAARTARHDGVQVRAEGSIEDEHGRRDAEAIAAGVQHKGAIVEGSWLRRDLVAGVGCGQADGQARSAMGTPGMVVTSTQ